MAETRANELQGELEDALALVADEAPLHFVSMRDRVGARAIVIRVGDAPPLRVCVGAGPRWVEVCAGSEARGAVELALSERELARLLRGEASLEDAILEGDLSARGELGDLLALFDGLSSWLHGALRSPSSPKLHQRCLAESAAASSGRAGQKGSPSC